MPRAKKGQHKVIFERKMIVLCWSTLFTLYLTDDAIAKLYVT